MLLSWPDFFTALPLLNNEYRLKMWRHLWTSTKSKTVNHFSNRMFVKPFLFRKKARKDGTPLCTYQCLRKAFHSVFLVRLNKFSEKNVKQGEEENIPAIIDPSRAVVLNLFSSMDPKKSKKFQRTPKLLNCTTCGPLNTFKRGWKGYNT